LKTKVQQLFARVLALLPCLALAAAPSALAGSSGILISDQHLLSTAALDGGTSLFTSNVTVTISGSASINISSNFPVVLDARFNPDGTTNTATITRTSGTGPIFFIRSGASLTLLNLTVTGGLNYTNGGAIYVDTGGTLILSNCVFSGNMATNLAGVAGINATTLGGGNNNGGNGGNGYAAAGGAIYSLGSVICYYSLFTDNSAIGGNGGNGGNGAPSGFFGGNAGNGGSGGGARGGAVVCLGPTNVFVATDFTGNHCTAGTGGTSGSAATGAFSGNPGNGGTGASAEGGALVVSGPLNMTNCLFLDNMVTAGSTSSFSTIGGSASGGGLAITSSTNSAFIENTTFVDNTCTGGTGGGDTSLNFHPAGNGGAASGGGLISATALAAIRNCTFATNTLTGGAGGTSSTFQSNGIPGVIRGADLARTAGAVTMADTILSGGTNATVTNLNTTIFTTYITNTEPNDSGGLTDLGFNFSSDTTVALSSALGGTENGNPYLDTALSSPGGTAVGLNGGPPGQTLALLSGSPCVGVIPGIPGITFPAYDQVYQPRSTPTCIGAYEANPLATNITVIPSINSQPVDTNSNAGSIANFQVGTNGPIEILTNGLTNIVIGFQWQHNGTNLMDGGRISGSWSNSLTINPVTTNDAGTYTVLVGESTLLSGSIVTSTPATLTVFVPVSIVVQPPSVVTPVQGRPVNLSVTATGAAPLQYQWLLNGTNQLVDNPVDIAGAATPTLSIYPLDADDAGTYSVNVYNSYSSVTSSVATLRIPVPTITVDAVPANVTSPSTNLMGTAAEEFGVTNVQFQLNDGGYNPASISTNGARWNAPLTLMPGTNTINVFATDILGQNSRTNTVTVFYTTNNALSLVSTGFGRITRNFTGDPGMLVAGKNYSFTAAPAPGNLFSNWTVVTDTSTSNSTDNPYILFLTSDTTLTANFVTNFFIPAAGAYNGLFYVAGGVAEETSGMITLTVKSNGSFNGRLFIDGTSFPISGAFDANGNATVTVRASAASSSGMLTVTLALSSLYTDFHELGAPPAPYQITGTVADGSNWSANFYASQAVGGGPSAVYTALLSETNSVNSSGAVPAGDGYALIANHAGQVTISGAVADGTAFSQSLPLPVDGSIPVYVSLYHNTGLLFGWINLGDMNGGASTNSLTWVKKASGLSTSFAAGLTNLLLVEGGPWTEPSANAPAIPFTNGLLVISNSNLSLVFDVAVTNNNAIVKLGNLPTNSLTGSINPLTGALNVVFGTGAGRATGTGAGAVLQSSNSAAGYFVIGTNAGMISLETNTSGLAPIIFQSPVNQNFAAGSNFSFSVRALGSTPLAYHWQFDGSNLSDGGDISGSATNQLNVTQATLTNSGSYSVIVSNGFGAATSLVAVLAVPPPAITIMPVLSTVAVPALTIQGTASGRFGVGAVQYQLDGGGWNPATLSNPSNWSASVTLTAGTNIFAAYSTDPVGNRSPVATVSIFYLTYSGISLVVTNGLGRITANFTSNRLVVGRNYTVTAVPAAGNIFSNWSGTLTSNANPLTFQMVSNMTIIATLSTNIFLPSAGVYSGLFSVDSNVDVVSAGMIQNLALRTNGIFSGKLLIAGTNYTLAGAFDPTGQTGNAAVGPLTVSLTLQRAPTNQITGTVSGVDSGTNWTATILTELAGGNHASAEYTMLFYPSNSVPNQPDGEGYALLTNHAGMLTLNGALADGSPFSETVPLSPAGDFPLYASPYPGTNTGLFFGWANVTNLAPTSNSVPTFTWIKRPSASAVRYLDGFTNIVELQASPWITPAVETPPIAFSHGTLDILYPDPANDVQFTAVAVLPDDTLDKLGGSPVNSLTGTIAPTTGFLRLTFGDATGTTNTQALGAVLQNPAPGANNGAGYFLTPTAAGAFALPPQ
jgi:hypothetical protein